MVYYKRCPVTFGGLRARPRMRIGSILPTGVEMQAVKTVELRTAYAFDCEHCGRENFVRAVVAELSEDERDELRSEHGVDGITGSMVTIPTTVTCCCCKQIFKTSDFRAED